MKKDRNCGFQGGAVPYGGVVAYGPNPGMPGQMAPGMMAPMPQGMMPQGMMPQGPMPAYPGMVAPIMPGTGMNPNMGSMTMNDNSGISTGQTVTAMEQMQAQINNLDRRVSRLESMMQDTKTSTFSNNKYTDSNYHMM